MVCPKSRQRIGIWAITRQKLKRLDRKKLEGADFCRSPSWLAVDVWRYDIEIPKQYGVDTNVGDTLVFPVFSFCVPSP
jgi:hypothetical protein